MNQVFNRYKRRCLVYIISQGYVPDNGMDIARHFYDVPNSARYNTALGKLNLIRSKDGHLTFMCFNPFFNDFRFKDLIQKYPDWADSFLEIGTLEQLHADYNVLIATIIKEHPEALIQLFCSTDNILAAVEYRIETSKIPVQDKFKEIKASLDEIHKIEASEKQKAIELLKEIITPNLRKRLFKKGKS